MTSLSDVYEGEVRTIVNRRQRLLGMTLFGFGTLLMVAAISLATTSLGSNLGLSVYEARQFAGILAGLGLPAVFVGIFAVLPASGVTRSIATIGASLAVFGVILFSYAYPYRWISNDPQLAITTTIVYTLGTLITFWCLFLGIATVNTRNAPGGTARLRITDEGTVRLISPNPSVPGFGSVGLFGRDPDGAVQTQTNTESTASPSKEAHDAVVMKQPTSDGGTAVADESGTDEQLLEAVKQRGRPDEYCGNCTHFEYVRADGELTPYCGFHDDLMDDMDACDQWQSNN